MDIPSEFLNNSALAASKALDNDMRSALAASLPISMSRTARRLYGSPGLKAWQEALGTSVKIDDSVLKACQEALATSVKIDDSTRKAAQALATSVKIDDSTRKAAQALATSVKIDDSTRKAAQALATSVKIDDSVLKACQEALATSMKYEQPRAPANPQVDALAPSLPPADLEDSPDGVLGVATAKMLMRLKAWGDLCAGLGRLCDENVEGLDAGRLEVARQIDECLSCLVMTAGPGGVCWGCGDATLMSHGVVCADCAAPVAQMVLESWFLTEGLEPD